MVETENKEKQSSGEKLLFIAGVVILIAVLFFGLFNVSEMQSPEGAQENEISPTDITSIDIESACQTNGGTFLPEYNECEFIDEATCTSFGGQFNECGSACRHETGPVACTMNCVPYCAF